jgi:hypothetical protein
MTTKKIYNKALRRSEVAKKAYELAKFATFNDYIAHFDGAKDKDAVIYTMTRIARLIGLPVYIRHGVVYERNADGEQRPIYIFS